jgi:hypothetical protein
VVEVQICAPGEALTVETCRVEDRDKPDGWSQTYHGGRFWIDTHAIRGHSLTEGHYRSPVWRGKQLLFTCGFTAVALDGLARLRRGLDPGALLRLATRCAANVS